MISGPSEERQADENDALDNEDKSQVIVDLRSEAKIAAQVTPAPWSALLREPYAPCLASVSATVKFVVKLILTAVQMPPYHPKKSS